MDDALWAGEVLGLITCAAAVAREGARPGHCLLPMNGTVLKRPCDENSRKHYLCNSIGDPTPNWPELASECLRLLGVSLEFLPWLRPLHRSPGLHLAGLAGAFVRWTPCAGVAGGLTPVHRASRQDKGRWSGPLGAVGRRDGALHGRFCVTHPSGGSRQPQARAPGGESLIGNRIDETQAPTERRLQSRNRRRHNETPECFAGGWSLHENYPL